MPMNLLTPWNKASSDYDHRHGRNWRPGLILSGIIETQNKLARK